MEKSFQVSNINRKVLGKWTTNPYITLNTLLKRPGATLNIRSSSGKIYQYQQLSRTIIIHYPKYNAYNDIFQLLATIVKNKIFSQPALSNTIIGHGYDHGYRVARLVMIESLIKHFSKARTETLILAALIHDIGRSRTSLSDENHGSKSIQLLAYLLGTTHLTSQIVNKKLFTNQLVNLTDDDLSILISIVKNHSLSVPKTPNELLTNVKLFVREAFDESVLEDCDALDRIRFKNNLNINFLRNSESFSLLMLASQLISSKYTLTSRQH